MRARVLAVPATMVLVGALLLRHSVLMPVEPLAPVAPLAHTSVAAVEAPELDLDSTPDAEVPPDGAVEEPDDVELEGPRESANTIHGRVTTTNGEPIGGVLITAMRGD